VALRPIGGIAKANTQRTCWTGDLRGSGPVRVVEPCRSTGERAQRSLLRNNVHMCSSYQQLCLPWSRERGLWPMQQILHRALVWSLSMPDRMESSHKRTLSA
jgi:hypothetical protein